MKRWVLCWSPDAHKQTSDPAWYGIYDKQKKQLEQLMKQWEIKQLEKEELEQQYQAL